MFALQVASQYHCVSSIMEANLVGMDQMAYVGDGYFLHFVICAASKPEVKGRGLL